MRSFHIMGLALGLIAAPLAASPRDALTSAAFVARDKNSAMAQVAVAEREAVATLARQPNNVDAALDRAMAIGYRAKLTRSRGDAETSRKLFEAIATSNPRDPEAQAALGGWHLDAIDQLGGMIARTVLGAKRATGEAALDRSVVLGRDRALFPALASLMRIRLNPKDLARSRNLAEAALKAPAPTALDRIMQKSAAAVLVPLRAGDGEAAARLARTLLPFGRLPK